MHVSVVLLFSSPPPGGPGRIALMLASKGMNGDMDVCTMAGRQSSVWQTCHGQATA
jgi:hypothetical protein